MLFLSLLLAGWSAAASFSTVVIDAGHGGADKGAQRAGVKESQLTLAVAKRLEVALKRKGIATVMTRRDDSYVSKEERVAITNRQRRPVLVSMMLAARCRIFHCFEPRFWATVPPECSAAPIQTNRRSISCPI